MRSSLGQRGVAALQLGQVVAQPGPVGCGPGGGGVDALHEPGKRRQWGEGELGRDRQAVKSATSGACRAGAGGAPPRR